MPVVLCAYMNWAGYFTHFKVLYFALSHECFVFVFFLELLQTTQKVDRDEGRKKDNRQLVVTYNKRKVSLETDPSMASKTY